MMRQAILVAALLAATSPVPAVAGPGPASARFAAEAAPSPGPAAPHGGYARGCLAGAEALPETGPHWQAVRLGRNRNWGHPDMVSFIERLGRRAAGAGWPRILVGDISQPRGGPMPSGHRSHQIGLDADIWLRIPGETPLTGPAREEMSSVSVVAPDRRRVGPAWRSAHAALIRLAAEDPAVDRIFVNAAIKRELCATADAADTAWLRKVRPWWGHDAHMHVRLACPEGAAACVAQEPPPPGDGCGAQLDWWFTDEALHPKPPEEPPAEIALADLPAACRGLVTR
jgi:penicillin-insensitive murein endopeptidase